MSVRSSPIQCTPRHFEGSRSHSNAQLVLVATKRSPIWEESLKRQLTITKDLQKESPGLSGFKSGTSPARRGQDLRLRVAKTDTHTISLRGWQRWRFLPGVGEHAGAPVHLDKGMGAHLHEGAAADGMTFLRQAGDDVRAEGRLVVMTVSTAMAGLPLVTPFHLM